MVAVEAGTHVLITQRMVIIPLLMIVLMSSSSFILNFFGNISEFLQYPNYWGGVKEAVSNDVFLLFTDFI